MWLFSECSNLLPPDRPRQPEATFEAEGGDWDENREQSHWTGTGLDEDGQLQVQNSRSPMRREYVSAVMLDCGDMYELNESVWDVLMFAGHPAIGSLNTSVLWGIYVLNLALQCMFIFLVQHLLMEEVISPQNLDGLLKFRLRLAHRAEYADKVTERSMAAQVYSFDRKLHLAGEQVDLFRDLNDFATGGLPAKLLICFIQYLWLCTILKDIENTMSVMTAVWRIPKCRLTRMVLADLRDEHDDIEYASSSSSDRDSGNKFADFMKVVRITSMALMRKMLVITAVGIPKRAWQSCSTW
ncbi:unnamed protein product [Prorocentrum cordatum]|uniref:Autophagy-related protein 9 n=1 Tax=Prorocentrum cordatum TaxID=2364126 RepID=A0ABN9TK29_9DINO|nr:unnamed protein product [Polarella glacialis]